MTPHRPRKRFGQHFLRDPAVIDAILDTVAPQDTDTIVEIGPGTGAITKPLTKLANHVHAVEIDRDLAAGLRADLGHIPNLTIHTSDALTFDYRNLGQELRLVGNLPYNISTPLLFRLLDFRDLIADMHFMLQKEVVDRMASPPGVKAYGRLTVMLGCRFEIESLFDVPRSAFAPPPGVTSAVVRLRPLPVNRYPVRDEAVLTRLVAAAFSQRRKTIRNALSGLATRDDFAAAGIDAALRPEAVPIAAFVKLANRLANGFGATNAGPVG